MIENAEIITTPKQGSMIYTCPMHSKVAQTEPGQCPRCGMKLVPKR